MEDLLFLCQRIPFPPNKGEKIRSFHILEHLSRHYRVHLGCFVDDPADETHVAALERYCTSHLAIRLPRPLMMGRMLSAFPLGISISEAVFRDRTMARWIETVVSKHAIRKAFVFCSTMAPYAASLPAEKILDIVDVDSEKWRAYANASAWPLKPVYAREGRKVLDLERRAVGAYDKSLFVSDAEAATFLRLAPEAAARVLPMNNGVDLDYFDPLQAFASPFSRDEKPIVFTGTMNYRPNAEGAQHFVEHIFPKIRNREPQAAFWIVGVSPSDSVKVLAKVSGVHVTGAVPDIRPYVANAECVVAPLLVARGVQNKILEAFAMARAVVASPEACEGMKAADRSELLMAPTPDAFADSVCAVLAGKYAGLGTAARARVEADYRWADNLKLLDELFSFQPEPA